MVKVKICGITNIMDAVFASRLGADYLGFVFADSPRRISPERASEIIKALEGLNVRAAGVFVNEDEEEIKRIAALCPLEVLQLHGDESPEFCGRFKGYSVFKAFRARNKDDIAAIKDYEADAFLIDSFVEGMHGGTGKVLSHDLALEAARYTGRLFLSGGLTPENVSGLIARVSPFGVDVSSGVEKSPGIKDEEKIKKFMDAVRTG